MTTLDTAIVKDTLKQLIESARSASGHFISDARFMQLCDDNADLADIVRDRMIRSGKWMHRYGPDGYTYVGD